MDQYNLAIPKEKLKPILIDLYLANASLEMSKTQNKDSLRNVFYTEICTIHKIKANDLNSITEQLYDNYHLNAIIQKEMLDTFNKLSLSGTHKIN